MTDIGIDLLGPDARVAAIKAKDANSAASRADLAAIESERGAGRSLVSANRSAAEADRAKVTADAVDGRARDIADAAAAQATVDAVAARDLARAWAEATTPPVPGSNSARTWAGESGSSAAQAGAARADVMSIRDRFAVTAGTAIAAVLAETAFRSRAEGEAATEVGQAFFVLQAGDTAVTGYLRSATGSTLINILSGQPALDRLGRYVPTQPGVEMSAVIQAALDDPLVAGVLLGAGDYSLSFAVVVPTGKFCIGRGVDVTRLVGSMALVFADYSVKALIRTAEGSRGCYIADMTVVAPKAPTKINGVWLRATEHSHAQRVKALNCGYAFWFQAARDCSMRIIQSYNAAVHFEATGSSDFLFEHMKSGDGDGDHPLGCEAVWHPLGECQDGKWRHGRHVGKGQPILVVNDAGGELGNITFDDLEALHTDDKVLCFSSLLGEGAKSIGKVLLRNVSLAHGDPARAGALMRLEGGGDWTMEGGSWKGYTADNFQIFGGAKLVSRDVTVDHMIAPGNDSSIYGVNGIGASAEVYGGVITTNANEVQPLLVRQGSGYLSPETRFVGPNKLGVPFAVGNTTTYVFPELSQAEFFQEFGRSFPGQPVTNTSFLAGTYRVRMRGKMRKTDADGSLYLASEVEDYAGFIRLQNADGSFTTRTGGGGVQVPAAVGELRQFEIDFQFTTVGLQSMFGFGKLDTPGGVTVLAGAAFSIERVA